MNWADKAVNNGYIKSVKKDVMFDKNILKDVLPDPDVFSIARILSQHYGRNEPKLKRLIYYWCILEW
ncbi:MAG: hypothetical protein ACOC80_07475 [Petrotogales bacterium]